MNTLANENRISCNKGSAMVTNLNSRCVSIEDIRTCGVFHQGYPLYCPSDPTVHTHVAIAQHVHPHLQFQFLSLIDMISSKPPKWPPIWGFGPKLSCKPIGHLCRHFKCTIANRPRCVWTTVLT